MIRRYQNFRNFFLFESLLKIDKDLHVIISKIPNRDPVAKMLLSLINQDIKTNVNYLKTSDKNDDLKFVNDTQVQRFVDAGEDPFNRAVNTGKIGRTVRQILTSNNISVTDQQIEKFVNSYKTAWDNTYKNVGEGFHLVSGEDIRHWYHENTYVPGGGTLNNSCMRYPETQEFLDIYTQNPEVCQLLILLDDKNRLLGRAIVWKLIPGTDKYGYYLDRIYTRFDNDVEKFLDWFKNFIKATSENFRCQQLGLTTGCKVQLQKWKFKKYPYMDTLPYLNYNTGILNSYDGEDKNELQFLIQNTSGDPKVPNHQWSEIYQNWLHNSECVWIDSLEDYVLKADCIKGYNNDWILKKDAIFSEYYNNYVLKQNATELSGFGLVDKNDICTVYDDFEGDSPKEPRKYLVSKLPDSDYRMVEHGWRNFWYHKSLVAYDAFSSEWILKNEDMKKNYIMLHKISESDFLEFEKFFGGFDEVNVWYDSYGVVDSLTLTPFVLHLKDSEGDRRHMVTQPVLEDFKIKSKSEYGDFVMKLTEYFRGFRKMCYLHTIKIINLVSKPNGLNCEGVLKSLQDVDNWLVSNNSSYRTYNESYQEMSKYGSYTQYFNSELARLFKENKLIEILNSDDFRKNLKNKIISNGYSFTFIENYNEPDETVIDIYDEAEDLDQKLKIFIDEYQKVILYFSYLYIL
jgi:hypothetical protein